MGQYKAAKRSLEDALTTLSAMSGISCKEKEANAGILKNAIAKFSSREDTKEEKEGEATKDPRLVLEEGEDEMGVASCLTVQSTEGAGRHTIANQEIPAGTLLATGDPAVALLNPDNKNLVTQFCLNCLRSVATPFPCFTCTFVAFCSPSCRSKALFHQPQCHLNLYRHRQFDTEVAFNLFLPLKWLWQKPFKFFRENWNEEGELVGEVDLEYARMWSMVTHLETRNWASLVNVTVVTIFLIRCNRLSSYCSSDLPQSDDGSLSIEEEWLGGILAHIFMVQDMNSHPFFGLDRGKQLNQVGLENLGSAIYPVIGRHFNHSCAPNTIRVNCGTKVYLLASATIGEGEEACDIYSMHFSEICKQRRQDWLSRLFHFSCGCKACNGDWPTFDHLDSSLPPDLMAKLQVIEKCIQSALGKGNLSLALDLHLRDQRLLEAAGLGFQQLAISLRNSLQCTVWRFIHSLPS